MRLPKRDMIATALVVVAGVLYLLWGTESALPGMGATRATGLAVLGLGFAASASAVVPSFDELLHGSKAYLAVASLIGLVALGAGIVMLVSASSAGLDVLMASTAVLWLLATARHSLLLGVSGPQRARPAGMA